MNGLAKAHNKENYTDEGYTPVYAITPILRYLKPNSKVGCPFDTEESNYYKELKNAGHEVIISHIEQGGDFLEASLPEGVDYIISNPPYSKRNEILKKLYELNTPFAILIPLATLETPRRANMFREHGVELLVFDKRVSFIPDTAKKSGSASMNTSYFCWNVLPDKLIFEEIKK